MRSLVSIAAIAAIVNGQNFLKVRDEPVLKPTGIDESSYANVDEIQTTKSWLDITIDFDKESVIGTNTLDMTAQKDGVKFVVLDGLNGKIGLRFPIMFSGDCIRIKWADIALLIFLNIDAV